MHIAVDLDDVVLDFVGGVRNAIKTEFGVALADDDFTQFNLRPLLDPIIGRSWWKWMRDRVWIWGTFPAVDGAIGSLEKLRIKGHFLECVTSKPEWAEYQVWRWMGRWRPPFHRVTIVGQNDRKADFTDAVLLIDDKMKNCEEFVDEVARPDRVAILFTRPHNKNEKPSNPDYIGRANDWAEVMKLIEEMEQ